MYWKRGICEGYTISHCGEALHATPGESTGNVGKAAVIFTFEEVYLFLTEQHEFEMASKENYVRRATLKRMTFYNII